MALYPLLLGDRWRELAETVRLFHSAGSGPRNGRFSGRFDVRRGNTLLARILGRLLRLPDAGDGVPVQVRITAEGGDAETWHRDFGGRAIVTRQRAAAGGLLAERFGPVELRFRLRAVDGALQFEQVSAAICLGRLPISLPRELAPQVTASAWPDSSGARMRVAVTIRAPAAGLLVAYDGVLDVREAAT